jgi:hypothetical protein
MRAFCSPATGSHAVHRSGAPGCSGMVSQPRADHIRIQHIDCVRCTRKFESWSSVEVPAREGQCQSHQLLHHCRPRRREADIHDYPKAGGPWQAVKPAWQDRPICDAFSDPCMHRMTSLSRDICALELGRGQLPQFSCPHLGEL